MKTNYNFNNNTESILGSVLVNLSTAVETGKLGENVLNESDKKLASAIVDDLKSSNVKENKHADLCIYRTKSFTNFPESIVANYMESEGITCSDDTPYAKPSTQNPQQGKPKKNETPVTQENNSNVPNNEDQPVQIGTGPYQVCQFKPLTMENYTILDNGVIKESIVDEEITSWFNLYNMTQLQIADPNGFGNFIIKLRSMIPTLKEMAEKRGMQFRPTYVVTKYTSPTIFELAENGSGRIIQVNGDKATITG